MRLHLSLFLGLLCLLFTANASYAQDPSVLTTFDGQCAPVNATFCPVAAWQAAVIPDANNDVGLSQVGQIVNNSVTFWSKASPYTQVTGYPMQLQTPWNQWSNNNGNTPNCGTAGTPNVMLLHDHVNNRWLIEKRIFSSSTGKTYACVAVSSADDVSLSTTYWFAYEADITSFIPTYVQGGSTISLEADYPQFSIWQGSSTSDISAGYITYDLLDPGNITPFAIVGNLIVSLDLKGIEAGTASSTTYTLSAHAPLAKAWPATYTDPVPFTLQHSLMVATNIGTTPVQNNRQAIVFGLVNPPDDHVSYLTNSLTLLTVQTHWNTNTLTLGTSPNKSTTSTSFQPAGYKYWDIFNTNYVPQPGTAVTLDGMGDRLMRNATYRNFPGTAPYESFVTVSTSQKTPASTPTGPTSVHWNEFRASGAAYGSGRPVAVNGRNITPLNANDYPWLPSATEDKVGNLLIGYNYTDITAGHLVDPSLGMAWINLPSITTTGGINVFLGPGIDTDSSSNGYRWGNWGGMAIDPVDGCTAWMTLPYLKYNKVSGNQWNTRVAKLSATNGCH